MVVIRIILDYFHHHLDIHGHSFQVRRSSNNKEGKSVYLRDLTPSFDLVMR